MALKFIFHGSICSANFEIISGIWFIVYQEKHFETKMNHLDKVIDNKEEGIIKKVFTT